MSFPRLRARHKSLRALPALAFVLTALTMAGCQEDTRASKMDAQRASQVADSRLKQAQSNLLATFEKPATADSGQAATQPAQNADSSAYRAPADQERIADAPPKTLVWSAPLTREDGSSLAPGQIAEYRIYYRLKYKDSFNVIALKDAGITRYVLDAMPPGAYEFSITTVDVEGLESRRSDPVEINLI